MKVLEIEKRSKTIEQMREAVGMEKRSLYLLYIEYAYI